MQRQIYTPEAARAGVTKESIDAANDRIDQAALDGLQAELTRIPALRAQAAEMLDVLLPGAARGAVETALSDLDTARTPAHQVVAARQLNIVIQQWAQAAVIDRDLARLAAPAMAADAQRRAAEERRPKVLTIEQRLDRIEKHLGLS